jgi:hypothetical protein
MVRFRGQVAAHPVLPVRIDRRSRLCLQGLQAALVIAGGGETA